MTTQVSTVPVPDTAQQHTESPQDVSLSVVIPVYNSEQTIGDVVEQLMAVLPGIVRKFEIILVEDGSRDRSWQAIEGVMAQHDAVRGFRLMRNYGQHNALLCGIRSATCDLIVTMDDDLQHPPQEIATLLSRMTDEIDVVYGSPEREQHGLWRDMASRITKLMLQDAMGAENARNLGPFRLFRTHLRDAFADYSSSFVNIDVLLTWGTTRFDSVRVPHRKREVGQSNYTFRKLVTHAVTMMTGFSTLPLQLASMIGFTMTVFGILLLFYIIVVRILIFGWDVPGFTFLASMISIFSGTQLFVLGIMGEYLARMHFRIMDKPSYIIRQPHRTSEHDNT